MTIKYYELLKVKTVERGYGYSKGLEIEEKIARKSTNIEKLISELEQHYENKDWILIPKHLIKDNPFRYEKEDYIIIKSEPILSNQSCKKCTSSLDFNYKEDLK